VCENPKDVNGFHKDCFVAYMMSQIQRGSTDIKCLSCPFIIPEIISFLSLVYHHLSLVYHHLSLVYHHLSLVYQHLSLFI
jgi:hypothetical protein